MKFYRFLGNFYRWKPKMEPLHQLRLSNCINYFFQVLKSFKSTDINNLKKMYFVYIRPKFEYDTLIWSKLGTIILEERY